MKIIRAKYYLEVFISYLKMAWNIMNEYPGDSIIWIVSMILREFVKFLGLIIIANTMGKLGGWTIWELCLLFAFGGMTEALSQAFGDAVWEIGEFVRSGSIDYMILRPTSVLIQVLGIRIQLPAVVSFGLSFFMFLFFANHVGVVWNWQLAICTIEMIICGFIINSSIYLIFNCLNFWLVRGESIAIFVQTVRELARYPLNVFSFGVQVLLTAILPFAFVAYYPSMYICQKETLPIPLIVFCTSIIIGFIAINVWKKGLRSYNSTGN